MFYRLPTTLNSNITPRRYRNGPGGYSASNVVEVISTITGGGSYAAIATGGSGPMPSTLANWKFEDTSWTEEIGSRTLTQSGTVTVTSGYSGNAVSFDGIGFLYRDDAGLTLNAGDWKIEFYYQYTGSFAASRGVTALDDGGSGAEFELLTASGNKLEVYVYDSSGAFAQVTSTVVLSGSTWYPIAIERSGTTLSLTVGTTITSTTLSITPYISTLTPRLLIGKSRFNSAMAGVLIDEYKMTVYTTTGGGVDVTSTIAGTGTYSAISSGGSVDAASTIIGVGTYTAAATGGAINATSTIAGTGTYAAVATRTISATSTIVGTGTYSAIASGGSVDATSTITGVGSYAAIALRDVQVTSTIAGVGTYAAAFASNPVTLTYTVAAGESYSYFNGSTTTTALNDSNTTTSGLIVVGGGTANVFIGHFTFAATRTITQISVWTGQFNGAFNQPTGLKVYSGHLTNAQALAATELASFTLATGSSAQQNFTVTPNAVGTQFTLRFTAPSTSIGILEIRFTGFT